MPSIYTSVTVNIIQGNNNSDQLRRVHSNNSYNITIPSPYIILANSTISPPPSNRLSGGAIFGIVLAVIVVSGLLCALIYYINRRRKHHKSLPTPSKPHHPSPGSASVHHPKVLPSLQCRRPLCTEYLARLILPEAYFAKKYDKCFCKKCHDLSNSNTKCGHWCTNFHGWTRLSLRVNEAHKKQWNIFQKWKTSYYGTSSNRLLSILNNRFVPFDGDTLADKTIFNSGHPDPTHCNTSPSLVCASQSKFTTRSNFRATDGNNYYVQIVLQCKQQPDTIIVKGDAKSPKNIEWTTKARCSVVPFSLLIRLQKM